ncbi:UDP-glucose 4-epimerase protein [Marine Group I thaumarchaeote SCGC RSA3]|uniref:dTDP-glucose 46-dehydratase protein n=2 Tax=Marine Group I TaxID=905826 RepID=A0A087RM28_9ARCH|nr:dTDP-glucose 46-dehydratase protein [Marine Group I thaumarchaeote SCGC AAA799-D11]KFM19926.1 UDP-glucose 4-epimerase protein [Marine Group I thaumarchaeote SCGC RSA3]
MKILIPGMDGYIGWALTLHQLSLGNEVCGLDNFSRRKNVDEMNSHSALPILSIEKRIDYLEKKFPGKFSFYEGDLLDSHFIDDVVKRFSPDAVVHLAEQPSAPFSMIDQEHNIYTQQNNVIGTLNLLHSIQRHVPNTHLVKLGTMGEYGYDPGLEIAEGFFEIEFRGKKATIPYPKLAGSWYHWSKVHDSNNIMFACKLWGLRCTDIMQGIVYGTRTHEITNENEFTRYDFDEAFGTVINRFCAQAVTGYPLTVYGLGGQTRGFLALVDSIQCISILLENPPHDGEYRVVNQFDQQYGVRDLAEKVQKVGKTLGLDVTIQTKENPRKEMEKHFYQADHEKLKKLGFENTRSVEEEIKLILEDLLEHKERIESKKDIMFKGIKWNKK